MIASPNDNSGQLPQRGKIIRLSAAQSLTKWTRKFDHRGRTYRLFKRQDDRGAPYYIDLTRRKERFRQTLETNDAEIAERRAKRWIDDIMAEKWEAVEAVKAAKSKGAPAVKVSALSEVMDVYPTLVSISRKTIKNNLGCMRLIVETVHGLDPAKAPFSLSQLGTDIIRKFQKAYVERYTKDIPQSYGAKLREARDRSMRTTRSVIYQARSLFHAQSVGDLRPLYAAKGVHLPDLTDFMKCKVEGKSRKAEYMPPPDAVVAQAFLEIEKLKDRDRNVYLAFWFAVGAGLRRDEIRQCQWEYLQERDGYVWIVGGIGKNGERIEVPMQSRAVESVVPVRKQSGPVIEGETGLEWAKRLNWWMRIQGWETEKKMHELRAYVGSLIYRKNPVAAMRYLRHKTLKQTEQAYVRYHLSNEVTDVL